MVDRVSSDGTDRRLTLEELLPLMVQDGLIDLSEVNKLERMYAGAQAAKSGIHPLVWLSERHLQNESNLNEELTLDRLTKWLAASVGLPYFHIDPLKIDVESVTSVISSAYAARYRILPVAVTDEEVTFATAEPYERGWELELSHVLQRDIVRVIFENGGDIVSSFEPLDHLPNDRLDLLPFLLYLDRLESRYHRHTGFQHVA